MVVQEPKKLSLVATGNLCKKTNLHFSGSTGFIMPLGYVANIRIP
jgi:hypothetical protein